MFALNYITHGIMDLAQVGSMFAVKDNSVYCQADGPKDQKDQTEPAEEFAYAEKLIKKRYDELIKMEAELMTQAKKNGYLDILKDQEITDGFNRLDEDMDKLSEEEQFVLWTIMNITEPVVKVQKSAKVVDIDEEYDYSFTKADFLAATATAAVTSIIGTALYKCFF